MGVRIVRAAGSAGGQPASLVTAKATPAPWLAFEKRLAEAIGALEEDQYLILSKKRGWGYVQFAAQGFYGIRGECVSNHYLDAAHALTKAQIGALGALGWLAPTGTPEEVRANKKKGGSPNYRDFEGPSCVAKAARLAVRTLADVFDVFHPGNLEYKSFDRRGRSILIPTLGLKREEDAMLKKTPDAESVADIRSLVLAAIRKGSGDADVKLGEDGGIGLRFGNGVVFVRVLDDPPCVRVFSPVLEEVTVDDSLIERVNSMNAGLRHLRVFVLEGTVYAAMEIFAKPFVAEYVWGACAQLGGFVAEVGERMHKEFGGRTAFGDEDGRAMVQ